MSDSNSDRNLIVCDMPEVRLVEDTDIPLLVEMFPEKVGAPANRHVERFERQRRGEVTCLVAWDDGCPIGCVHVRWPGRSQHLTQQAVELGCCEVGDLFVSDGARARGVGRALMVAVEELVRARGEDLIGLEVTASNPHQAVARELYRKMGYEDGGFGGFTSGYTYWDADGNQHRDEEPYRYLVKKL